MTEHRDQQEVEPGRTTHRAPRAEEAARQHDRGAGLASTLGNAGVGRVLSSPGVQRAGATGAQQLDESVARAIEERRGGGRPLEEGVRRQMEGTLGHELSDVRVHTDGAAHQLNEAVSARAFTAGSDVFFKQGTYDPASSSGRELLGHELTHVVQQRTGTSGLAPGEVSHPSDGAEQHAEAVGQHAAQAAPQTSVARQEEEEEEPMQMSADPSAVQRESDDDVDEDAG